MLLPSPVATGLGIPFLAHLDISPNGNLGTKPIFAIAEFAAKFASFSYF